MHVSEKRDFSSVAAKIATMAFGRMEQASI